MKLTKGQSAIDFTMKDIYGNDFKLSDIKGSKILLSFYRNVNCPFCNRRVHKLMANNLRLKKSGLQIVFMFESSSDKLAKSAFHQGISPWPLIGDPEKKVYTQYGVESSFLKVASTILYSSFSKVRKETAELNLPEDNDASKYTIAADFLIDEDFNVEKAHYGKHLDDHLDFAEIKKFAGLRY